MKTTALITGASSGIGYELARLFATDGHDLVLAARSADRLSLVCSELHTQFGITARAVPVDLSLDGGPGFLFDEISRAGVTIQSLVNNAGYGRLGEFFEIPLEETLGQIRLNVTALTELTHRFIPGMRERGSGRIMNVASTAGFQAGPRMAVYYATKAYVISFSEALASELRGSGVSVTCFCPGATDTEFQKRARTEHSILFRKLRPMGAKEVARDGYRAMMRGRSLAISGWRNWLVAESVRFAPRKIVTAISRKILDEAE